jgi:hypothetical protein
MRKITHYNALTENVSQPPGLNPDVSVNSVIIRIN